jgi:ubiquinone/menaquinone biosynthesis C-methylase UbiE
MAILTIHHWPDKEAGLREMRRVTRGRIVLLTFDPSQRPWLTDYLPELAALDEAISIRSFCMIFQGKNLQIFHFALLFHHDKAPRTQKAPAAGAGLSARAFGPLVEGC